MVLVAVAAAARRHPGARGGASAADGAQLASRGEPRRAVVRRGQGRGAHQLGVAVGQAGGADLCRAGHVVRRHRAVRRPAAHARCQRPRRDHAAGRAQGRLQGAAGAARRAVRRAAAPELPPPAADVQPDRGPEHPAARRAPGQADPAAGQELRRRAGRARSASACSWRRKTWRNCWARRASA